MKDKNINDDQLTPFSGELEIEDLEFLSEEQPEMIAGGFTSINGSFGGPISPFLLTLKFKALSFLSKFGNFVD